MADFPATNPPASITNPGVSPQAVNADYPRHVHKGYGATYEYCIVKNDEEKAAALAEGFTLEPAKPPVKDKFGKPVPPHAPHQAHHPHPPLPPHPGMSDEEAERLYQEEAERKTREQTVDSKLQAEADEVHDERVEAERKRLRAAEQAAEEARAQRKAEDKVSREEDAKRPHVKGKP